MNRPLPDAVILGLLKAQPTHGYDLLERFRSPEQLGHIWTMSTSQLYAVLKRLETEGAIQGQEVEVPDAPSRTEYSVTAKGVRQLDTWLNDPNPSTSIHRIRVMFLSRVYIADLLGENLTPIIKNQEEVCQRQRQKIRMDRDRSNSMIEQLALDFVISQLDAALTWLEEISRKL